VALIAAKGFALVAAIKGSNVPKAASGGSFMVPGGSVGFDNKLVAMRLAAGERVDVTPASRAGQGGSGVTVVNLQMPSGSASRFVEELITDINSKIADGYRLNVATS
jgi:hypothetical protein